MKAMFLMHQELMASKENFENKINFQIRSCANVWNFKDIHTKKYVKLTRDHRNNIFGFSEFLLACDTI